MEECRLLALSGFRLSATSNDRSGHVRTALAASTTASSIGRLSLPQSCTRGELIKIPSYTTEQFNQVSTSQPHSFARLPLTLLTRRVVERGVLCPNECFSRTCSGQGSVVSGGCCGAHARREGGIFVRKHENVPCFAAGFFFRLYGRSGPHYSPPRNTMTR